MTGPKGRPRARTLAQQKTAATDAQHKSAFCDALGQTASVSKACEISGLPRRTAYDWRKADAAFGAAWDAALELGTDALEDEATRRAREGVQKPVYQGGKLVGHVQEYSDTLMIFMLKARRPDRFKDRVAAEHTGKDGGPIEIADVRQRLAGRIAGLAARIRPADGAGEPDGSRGGGA